MQPNRQCQQSWMPWQIPVNISPALNDYDSQPGHDRNILPYEFNAGEPPFQQNEAQYFGRVDSELAGMRDWIGFPEGGPSLDLESELDDLRDAIGLGQPGPATRTPVTPVKRKNGKRTCAHCGLVAESGIKLTEHAIELDHQAFECELCEATFRRHDTYSRHVAEHEEKPRLQCPSCDDTFKEKRHLRSHQARKHADTPGRQSAHSHNRHTPRTRRRASQLETGASQPVEQDNEVVVTVVRFFKSGFRVISELKHFRARVESLSPERAKALFLKIIDAIMSSRDQDHDEDESNTSEKAETRRRRA